MSKKTSVTMSRSEFLSTLSDMIIVSLDQRDSCNRDTEPEKYGFYVGKIFAYHLMLDSFLLFPENDPFSWNNQKP